MQLTVGPVGPRGGRESTNGLEISVIRQAYPVKEIRKLKSQDSRTSECLRFTGPTKKSEKGDEMSILYRGPSIDGSYEVSVHLAEDF
jgi:hypothetical protein